MGTLPWNRLMKILDEWAKCCTKSTHSYLEKNNIFNNYEQTTFYNNYVINICPRQLLRFIKISPILY